MGLYPTDWPRCNRGKCTHHCAPQWFVGDAAQDFSSLTTTSLLPMICDPKKCRKEIILNHHKLVLWCFVSPPCPAGITMSTVSAIRLECAGFLSDAIVSKLVGGCSPTIFQQFFLKTCLQIPVKNHPHMDPYGLWTSSHYDMGLNLISMTR